MNVRRIDFGASRIDNMARAVREAMTPRRPMRRAAAAEGVRGGAVPA